MKIVQIVTQMEAGGAQRVAVLLSEALRQKGYDSEVWFLYLKRPSHSHLPDVKVLFETKPKALDYLTIARRLHAKLSIHQPDVTITHTHYANVMGQAIARWCGVPQRIAVQHNPIHTYPKVAAWADWFLGTTAFYSDNVAVSKTVVQSTVRHPSAYRRKLTQIYNGIPTRTADPVAANFRKQWGLPENVPLLLNVGRLAHQKNQAVLIESLLTLKTAHLAILGEGELRESLRQKVTELQIADRVHFLGELPSEDVARFFSASDVFVFPSLYEAMPMALVEAMSAGIPIVASDIPALREVLGDTGSFVPADNAVALAQAIQTILDSPALARGMQAKLLGRAQVFSLKAMADSYETLFA
ncbi:glycosyltransferase family 4 protein [Altericista sp. CCNU0014]|uniref:glycosyltransferase family 4 protein n=1 Tax=Altericista sp. CCNU0014 TaxID=3082949 RepID=UPI00384EF382